MNNKDDNDFYEILGGGCVHDADPKNAKLAGALRGALLARQERPHLPPLRLPSLPKIKVSKPFWVPLWLPATITVALLVGISTPLLIDKLTPQSLESREKNSPTFLELKSSEPEQAAQKIQKVLQAAGIESTSAQEENFWILEFQSPVNQREIVVEIGIDGTQTTP